MTNMTRKTLGTLLCGNSAQKKMAMSFLIAPTSPPLPRKELLLMIAGGIFVAETTSVLAQRYYFKATGRRIFLCAPLHHHYQFLGWPESKIVVRFWITAALLSILAVATLKLR